MDTCKLRVVHASLTYMCLDQHLTKGEVSAVKPVKDLQYFFLPTVPRRYFFCGSFVLFISCVCLFIAALWSPAGKGLTSWLSFMMFNCFLSLFRVVSCVRCGT